MSLFDELKRRNVIRVAAGYIVLAWLVVQVVETIFPAFGFGDEAVRFVVIGFAVGFIPVVVLAWVFEWTPEGIKVDEGVEQRGPRVAAAARRWDRIVMAILVVAVTYFIVEKVVLSVDAEPSIAVLPFVSTSADPDKAYFGPGVADEVRSLLARIPQIYVTSQTSSSAFADQGLSVAEIADKLDVDHVLEGSVRQSGDQIRVTAQLIDTRTDRNLWSGTWERPMSDVFRIQDDIVADVVSQMRIELDRAIPASRRTDPAVLALVMKARQIYFDNYGGFSEAGVSVRMRSLLEDALEIDPDYAPAISWLAYANSFAVAEGLISRGEEWRRWELLKERVLAIDPNDPTMLHSIAFQVMLEDGDLETAADLYQRALFHGPNDPETLRFVGKFAYLIGRYEESQAILERSVRIHPLCSSCLYDLSRSYWRSGDLDKAYEVRSRYIKLGLSGGRYIFGLIQLALDDTAAALDIFEGLKNDAARVSGLAMAYHSLGRRSESEAMVEDLSNLIGETDPGELAEPEAWRGNVDAAFGWLFRMIDSPETAQGAYGGVKNYVGRPILKALHDDPRWALFREQAGMAPERLAALDVDLSIPD